MLQFFKKIMLWSLAILCLGFVLALLVFAIWWLGLPTMGIIIAVCLLAAVGVLFFSGRRLRIWLHKRNYVQQVLTKTPTFQYTTPESQNPMLRAWQTGMDVFAHSSGAAMGTAFGKAFSKTLGNSSDNMKKTQAVYRQSWALMLGRDACESQRFIQSLTGSATSQSNLEDPLRWHFLPDMVLLEADASLLNAQDPLAQGQWEEFLTQVADDRTKEPINALIITVNAKDLYADTIHNSPETQPISAERVELEASQIANLREYGNLLRSRIGQILAVASAKLPVYVLVNGMHELHGMHTLPLHLPAAMRKKLLGACFPIAPDTNLTAESPYIDKDQATMPSIRTLAKQAIESAVYDIRVFIANEAVQGTFPNKDELYAPNVFQRLEEGLCIFLESVMRPIPHGCSPLLRCIAFTCTAKEQENPSPLAYTSTPPMSQSAALETNDARSTERIPQIPSPKRLEPLASLTSMSSVGSPQAAISRVHEPTPTNSHSNKKLEQTFFISDLFTHILPADRLLYQPSNKTPFGEAWIFPGFLGYYLLLFSFCGILAVNAIYTLQTLEGVATLSKENTPIIPIPSLLNPLQASYDRMTYLGDAHANWIFPFIGQNRLALEQKKEEENFAAIMQKNILPLILQDLSQNKNTFLDLESTPYFEEKGYQPSVEDLKRIIWMQEAVNLRIKEGTSTAMRTKPFPIVRTFQDEETLWNIGFGELFLHFIDINSVKSLSSLQTYLAASVQNILDTEGEYFFVQMEALVNAELSAAAIPISRFWPTMPGGSPYFTSISPIYTAKGFARMQDVMSTIWELNHSPENSMENNPYWQQYLIRYALAWADFVAHTDFAWGHVTRTSALKDMAKISRSNKAPYVGILSSMAENLEPLRNNPIAPKWVEEIFLLNTLTELASLAAKSDANSLLTTPSILMNIVQSSPKNMEILQAFIAVHKPTGLVDAVSALANYFNALDNIHMTLDSDAGSFELARVHFGGEEYGKVAESHFTIAENALFDALLILNIPTNLTEKPVQASILSDSESPAVSLLHGPYRFLSHALTCVAAQKLQKTWEASVMPAAVLVPIENAPHVLFGEQGIVTNFLITEAAPFFERQVGYYEANRFATNIFPFTIDFLNFIQQGQEIKQVEPKESYEIRLISQTSSLNPDATEYLQYIELSLQCKDKTYTLRNSNYPETKIFSYNPKTCTGVSVDFYFPSLHLRHEYATFPEFLREFSYGEREFSSHDFPDDTEAMEDLAIRRIDVRILPENASEVLETLDTVLVPLPTRICGVW